MKMNKSILFFGVILILIGVFISFQAGNLMTQINEYRESVAVAILQTPLSAFQTQEPIIDNIGNTASLMQTVGIIILVMGLIFIPIGIIGIPPIFKKENKPT